LWIVVVLMLFLLFVRFPRLIKQAPAEHHHHLVSE
jgi:hypothetical protein